MFNAQNKLYLPLVFLLGIFTFSLNLTVKSYECALVGVLLCSTVNFITTFYGRKKALQSLLLSVLFSLCLLWNYKYYMQGHLIKELVIVSLVSVTASAYFSTNVFIKRSKQGFNTANLISLITFSVLDGLFMGLFFATKYSANAVLYMSLKELSCKLIFSGIVWLVCYATALYKHQY